MPDREFLLQPDGGQLRSITFAQAADQARRMAAALLELGLEPGDRVAILGKNSAEWVLADLAIAMAGLISVPIYPTANAETVAYVLEHSEAKLVFVGKLDKPDQLADAIPEALPSVAFPYPTLDCRFGWQELLDSAEPLEAAHEPDPADAMTILYTSGSTGQPKGVVISYGAYLYGCNAACQTVDYRPDDRLLSYLPLAHVTERMVLVGPSILSGARVYFVESLKTFTRDLKAANPTIFGSVPRLWVKFQAGVHAKVPPKKLRALLAVPVLRGIVARHLRSELGFAGCRIFASGTAPISPHTLAWYQKLGINIGEGWGMTEISGLACANIPFEAARVGTIGVPLEGTELEISDQGELLIRSPGLFTEYYKQPDLTAESFTEDGYFRTGDKAEWDDKRQGYRITGRVKEIFKSAKGKYVSPVPIESKLAANALVEQVCVMGAGLRAPVAVVVTSAAAQEQPREEVRASLERTLNEVNATLESHEKLSHLIVDEEAWSIENGLLTPTLKIKRGLLEGKYEGQLAAPEGHSVVWVDA